MMKRILLLTGTLILAASTAKPQISDNAPWNVYTVKGERLSIALPALPALQTSKEVRARPQKDRQRRVIKCAMRGVVYTINIVENPKAARKIKFIPATKDGKNVSMWMQLEYNFNLY